MPRVKAAMTPKQFRDLLAASGLTQVTLAERIGVDKQTVNRWATGRRKIDKFKAAAITAILKK